MVQFRDARRAVPVLGFLDARRAVPVLVFLAASVPGCGTSSSSAADTADVLVAADGNAAESRAPDSSLTDAGSLDTAAADAEADAATVEVDDTPGCAGDFCAAGPEHAPDPSKWGPFPVGVTTTYLDLVDHLGEPRTIRVEIWYPTTDEYREGPFDQIDFYDDAPPEAKDRVEKFSLQLPPIEVQASRDTPVRTGDGPYPLVVFSHGAYGIRFQSVFYTVPLASHGYVVAAMDHTGNVLYDLLAADGYNFDDMILSALDRPYDVVVTTAMVTSRSRKKGDMLYGSVREDAIGLSGHSFGGFTSFLVPFLDPRIKAVVAHSPATSFLSMLGYDVKDFPAPVMIQGGMLDKTLDPEKEVYPIWPKLPAPKFQFMLKTGGHFTYSDICLLDLVYIAESLGFDDATNALDDGCADFNLDPDVAHVMINQFAIGFFNYYLRGSKDSLKYFDADAAKKLEADLQYQIELGSE